MIGIHPLVWLGIGLGFLAAGHSETKPTGVKPEGNARERARAMFNITPECVLSVRDTPVGATSTEMSDLLSPMDQEYFFPMIAVSYEKDIRTNGDLTRAILGDLFPECSDPFTLEITSAVHLHVLHLKLAQLGYGKFDRGVSAFQEDWNRFVVWLAANDPQVIADNPIYKTIDVDGEVSDPGTLAAIDKAYGPFSQGAPIQFNIKGELHEVDNFWGLVQTVERVAATSPVES